MPAEQRLYILGSGQSRRRNREDDEINDEATRETIKLLTRNANRAREPLCANDGETLSPKKTAVEGAEVIHHEQARPSPR